MSFVIAVTMAIAMTIPASALTWRPGFDTWGGYTNTIYQYYFMTEDAVVVYGKDIDEDIESLRHVLAGSDLLIPIGVFDEFTGSGSSSSSSSSSADDGDGSSSSSSGSTVGSNPTTIATEKDIKNHSVELSYKVLEGETYVDNVEMVVGKKIAKKEKLNGTLKQGMYVRVTFAHNYMPLEKERVAVRLVLSVNGVSYQETAITFYCELQNRVELMSRNSVYGALTPAQFSTRNYTGEVTIDFGDGIRYTSDVNSNSQYYVNLDKELDQTLKDMYPDAYIECYDFKGNNDTFASKGKLEIPIKESKFKEKKTKAEVYIYTKVGNSLRAISLNNAQYNHKTQTVVISTESLDSYVFSSRPLIKSINNDQYDILRSGYADSITLSEDEPSED